MLEVVGGQKPKQHQEILSSKQYLDELGEDDLDAFDADDAPGMYRHLKYLSDFLTDPDSPDYCDQVCFLSQQIFCLIATNSALSLHFKLLACACMQNPESAYCVIPCCEQHAPSFLRSV